MIPATTAVIGILSATPQGPYPPGAAVEGRHIPVNWPRERGRVGKEAKEGIVLSARDGGHLVRESPEKRHHYRPPHICQEVESEYVQFCSTAIGAAKPAGSAAASQVAKPTGWSTLTIG